MDLKGFRQGDLDEPSARTLDNRGHDSDCRCIGEKLSGILEDVFQKLFRQLDKKIRTGTVFNHPQLKYGWAFFVLKDEEAFLIFGLQPEMNSQDILSDSVGVVSEHTHLLSIPLLEPKPSLNLEKPTAFL